MNNYSNMSGLDLFTDPFSRTPQAYNQPPVRSSSTVASHQKTAATQPAPDRRAAKSTQPKPVTAQAQQTNTVAKQTTPIKAPATQENVKATEPLKEQEQKPTAEAPAPTEAATPADTKPEPPKQPKKALELDMSTGGKITDEDDVARRKHEEAEKKRRELWEAQQAEKRRVEEETLKKLQDMSDDDAIAESIKRVSTEVERITRRNMKECVAEHIQELAKTNPDFARKILNPRKSMTNSYKRIFRMAKNYIEQEMKDNDIKPENGIGGDVPDDIVYQWAYEYFSTDAPEDKVEEEKFIPKPYVGKTSKPKKTASKPKKSEKAAAKDTAKNQKPKDDFEQMSLF